MGDVLHHVLSAGETVSMSTGPDEAFTARIGLVSWTVGMEEEHSPLSGGTSSGFLVSNHT